MTSDHVVTPSDQVDQAWHLHLTYTESYWTELCGKLLKRPLHHGPTKGGAEESALYQDLYEKTKHSYRTIFEQEPPADIWPDPRIRFGTDLSYQRVNLAHYWLVPKPRLFGRTNRALQALLPAFAVLPLPLGFTNPLDLPGSEFLILFAALFVLTVAVIVLRMFFQNDTSDAHEESVVSDPYELAYLAGGSRRVTEAATAALARCGLLEVAKRGARFVPTAKPLKDSHPVEKIVYASLCAADGVPHSGKYRQFASVSLRKIEDALARKGLMQSRDSCVMMRWWSVAAMFPLIVLAVLKLMVGISREKPVGFLVIGLLLAVAFMCWFAVRKPRRTKAGRRLLYEMRDSYREGQLPNQFAKTNALDSGLSSQIGLLGLAATLGASDPVVEAFLTSPRHGSDQSACGGLVVVAGEVGVEAAAAVVGAEADVEGVVGEWEQVPLWNLGSNFDGTSPPF